MANEPERQYSAEQILERATGIAFGDAPDVIFQYPDRVEAMRKLDGDAEYETNHLLAMEKKSKNN